MPFPLHALDYGSRCRLRELATPGEVYDLQIAAPHLDGLNPIQKVDTISQSVKVFINNDNEFCADEVFTWDPVFGKPLKLINDELYCVEENVHIENFTTDHCAQIIFDRFIFDARPRHLEFKNCVFTKQFLNDISSKTKSFILGLQFSQCRLHDGVSHTLICMLFKELKYLTFDGDFWNVNWIDTLITLNYANMERLAFYNVSISILNIDETQLIKFIKAQTFNFFVDIVLTENTVYQEVRQTLDRLFSERFWCVKKINFPRSGVNICWRSTEGFENIWYRLRKDIDHNALCTLS